MSAFVSEKTAIAVVGPTASGKTGVAVHLAKLVSGEIINADSMQIWRKMDIGTAKPTPKQQASAVFHLVDIADFHESFSAAKYKKLADSVLEDIISGGKIPILCGGTGLYVRSVVDGYQFAPQPDPAVRRRLLDQLEEEGPEPLISRLLREDPESARRLGTGNIRRVVRALEVLDTTGKTLTDHLSPVTSTGGAQEDLEWKIFGLFLPTEELGRRIDARIDNMMQCGLLEEVRELVRDGLSTDLQSGKALGYQEVMGFLKGDYTLERAVQLIRQNTRRFAKRQRTWFKADTRIEWLDMTGITEEQAAEIINNRLASH